MNGYRFHQVIGDGDTEIATDSAPPSSADPSDSSRVASLPAAQPNAANGFVWHLLDGTSIAFQIWIFEEGTSTWVKWGTAVTVTTVPQVQTTAGAALPVGTRVFMQVTANAGTTKQVAWRYC